MNTFVFYAIIFTAYGLCLAYLLQSVEGKTWIKAAIGLIFVIISTGVAFSYSSFMGWPVKANPAKFSKLVAVHIKEPTQTDKGQIYLWILEPANHGKSSWIDLFHYRPEKTDPRSIKIPYTKESQKRMQKAKEALQDGYEVVLEGEDAASEGSDKSKNGKPGKGGRNPARDGQVSDEIYEGPVFSIIDPRAQQPKD